jgi:hypothetical protein
MLGKGVTKGHGEPGGSLKQRQCSLCFQGIFNPVLADGRGESLGSPIIREWTGVWALPGLGGFTSRIFEIEKEVQKENVQPEI